MRILVSACLLGLPCRYDGKEAASERILALSARHTLIPVCPEQLGGLSTPREPCEIAGGRVLTKNGQDRTAAFQKGADCALKIYRTLSCDLAILKAKSPSCGLSRIYDGTFSRALTPGNGLTAARLLESGASVLADDDPRVDAL